MGVEFLEAVTPLTPIEKVPVDTEPLKVYLRERYRDYIKEELPKLAELVGADWEPDEVSGGGGFRPGGASQAFGGGGGDFDDNEFDFGGGGIPKSRGGRRMNSGPYGAGGTGGQMALEEEPLVYWDTSNQGFIESSFFDWSSEQDNTPNTLQVLYAQEDLWVLRALLEVIRKTNGDIQEHHRTAIKEIEHIYIGMYAGGRIGRVTRIGQGSAGLAGAEFGGEFGDELGLSFGRGMEPGFGAGQFGGMTGGPLEAGGDPSAAGVEIDPAEGRYVDSTHNHVPADQLRNPTVPTGPDAEIHGVAKRMPIRMRLVVDQRSLYKLLVECANSPLTVEIHQVRFNPEAIKKLGGAGMGMVSGLGVQKPQKRKRNSDGFAAGMGGAGLEMESTFEITVEIYGLIHIYNPVNQQLLRNDPKAAIAQDQPNPGAPSVPGVVAGG